MEKRAVCHSSFLSPIFSSQFYSIIPNPNFARARATFLCTKKVDDLRERRTMPAPTSRKDLSLHETRRGLVGRNNLHERVSWSTLTRSPTHWLSSSFIPFHLLHFLCIFKKKRCWSTLSINIQILIFMRVFIIHYTYFVMRNTNNKVRQTNIHLLSILTILYKTKYTENKL